MGFNCYQSGSLPRFLMIIKLGFPLKRKKKNLLLSWVMIYRTLIGLERKIELLRC